MLERIKSSLSIKIVFSCLSLEIKFKLFRYSKVSQKKINLSLFDYKIFSGRYIISGEKGQVKEYSSYTDELIFEGEYLNNKRNGKGKEYYNNYKLKFDGEYLNGKKHGKCKEYNVKGELIFEGEYLNGIMWEGDYLSNTGKKYNIRKGIKFLINNKKIDEKNKLHGIGRKSKSKSERDQINVKEYDDEDNLIFEGEYLYGYRNGKGEEYYKDKSLLFKGQYINGKRNGCGKEYYDNKYGGKIKYEGQYLNGKRNGKGKEYNKKGDLIFEGEYLYNCKKTGKAYINGKLEFEGDYLFNKKFNGNGYNIFGEIIYQLKNGNGKVKEYNDESILIFEGQYLDGKKNGKVEEYDDYGGLIYKGEYLNGRRNGKGEESNGKIIYKGEYLNGRKNGKGKEYTFRKYLDNSSWEDIFNENNYLKIDSDSYRDDSIEIDYFENIYLNSCENESNSLEGYSFKADYFEKEKDIKTYEFPNRYFRKKKKSIKKRKIKLKLIFDGEYLNGERLKGRELETRYDNDDKLIFEGEYIDGILHGKEYNTYGKLIFEGEYFKGKNNEKKGKAYNFGKLEFDGVYINDNKWNGKGYDKNNNIIYELKDGNGYVKIYSQLGQLIYEGNYLNGEKHGKGKEFHDIFGYVIFDGEYLKGQKWKGKGKQYDNSGKLISEDIYLDGKIIENNEMNSNK